ncbi:hypothetical protein [Campylobacter sp. RM16187]|uniref:hypothetical protein n=1 Tax=Campylobacter sp. RM16187 TaxID=1660063 RepID=UPI0021B541BF|nr:hypothetical protein [Campylobacter sp. RM16187]QKG28705.1 CRISPR/Cas system-associated RAMP protein Csm5, type III-A/MTUBE [Campylobacter sp. RM16187]
MSFVKHYKLKIKSISPVHIGTGDCYEPINYVMDRVEDIIKGEKKSANFLFAFDETKFYSNLSNIDKQEFTKLISQTDTKEILNLQKFIIKNKEIARKASIKRIRVSDEIFKEYTEKIGKAVQKEGGKNYNQKEVLNQLLIQKCYTMPNGKHQGVIPGSSLKGAISTAYQEMLSENADYEKDVKTKLMSTNSANPFRLFLVGDSSEARTKIYRTVNIKRNLKNDEIKSNYALSTRLEAIVSGQEIEASLSTKEDKSGKFLDIKDIIRSCNNHYMPIFRSMFDEDDAVRDVLSDKFYDSYREFNKTSLKANEFLLRIGKHSGARAVTVEGIRDIKVYHGKKIGYKSEKEETTAWLVETAKKDNEMYYNPLGWVLCSIEEINL